MRLSSSSGLLVRDDDDDEKRPSKNVQATLRREKFSFLFSIVDQFLV